MENFLLPHVDAMPVLSATLQLVTATFTLPGY